MSNKRSGGSPVTFNWNTQGAFQPGPSAMPPEDLPALLTRAVEALQAADLDTAEPLARKAAEIAPDNADCHLILATVLQNRGRAGEAEHHYLESLRIKPAAPRALINLGMLRLSLERGEEAVDVLEQALAMDPSALDARHYLARAYGLCGRSHAAIAEFETIEARAPNEPEVLTGYARALSEAERLEDAIKMLQRAEALRPRDHAIKRELGVHHAALGAFDQAEELLRAAIAIAPDGTDAYYQLSLIRRFSEDDAAGLKAHIGWNMEIAPRVRAAHLFALGDHYERNRDHVAAFDAYADANALLNEESTFNAAAEAAYFDALKANFDGPAVRSGSGGDATDKPLFIVGLPRSGSTLVEQVLAAHELVFAGGERRAMPQSARAVLPEEAFATADFTGLGGGELGEIAGQYMAQFSGPEAERARRWTDKMLSNVRLLPLIAQVFPNARFILCRRHPMDLVWSVFKQRMSRSVPYAGDLSDIALTLQATEHFMAFWKGEMPERTLEVRYEDLVADLAAGARRIVDFAGLKWEPACADPHTAKRGVRTSSMWQVRQPVYGSSVGLWKAYADRLEDVERQLAGVVAGYETVA